MRKIPDDVRAEEGRALARLGDGGWDPLVQAGRSAGRFDDELVDAAAEVRARAGRAPVRVGRRGPVAPQRRAGARTSRARLAERARAAVRAPCSSASATRPPQREMANSAQQVANVRGAFAVTAAPPPGAVPARRRPPLQRLDARDGRPASCAGKGAGAVYPLALSTAF